MESHLNRSTAYYVTSSVTTLGFFGAIAMTYYWMYSAEKKVKPTGLSDIKQRNGVCSKFVNEMYSMDPRVKSKAFGDCLKRI